uniref:Uncharacterized protein n=1 Tax=Arundo donax TaxID=35708 RepID=A0A0A8YUV8_ARUDO
MQDSAGRRAIELSTSPSACEPTLASCCPWPAARGALSTSDAPPSAQTRSPPACSPLGCAWPCPPHAPHARQALLQRTVTHRPPCSARRWTGEVDARTWSPSAPTWNPSRRCRYCRRSAPMRIQPAPT